jgi:transcription antitermination factor NusG
MANIVHSLHSKAEAPSVTFMAVACVDSAGAKMDLIMTEGFKPGQEENAVSFQFPWYALQVRARQELLVSDYLSGNGYEWFLPQFKLRKRWSDRIKQVDAPLFPGYLFCRFNVFDRLPILKIPGVIQILGNQRQPIPVDEQEIRAIQSLVSSGVPNEPWPYLALGDKVRIESGPLRGLEGLLVEVKGNHRLVLSVTLLQRSVAVEIDSAFVTVLESTRSRRLEKAATQRHPIPVAV